MADRGRDGEAAVIHYERRIRLEIGRSFFFELGSLYFYREQSGDPYAERRPYVGVGMVEWETRDRVWLKALRADMPRVMQRELLQWLVSAGIKFVKAEREPGRALPMARRVDDHEEIDVDELAARVRSTGEMKPHRRATDDPEGPGA